MTAFATLDDLETLYGDSFDVAQAARAELLLDFATAEIRNYTRQTISRETTTESLAGLWGAVLELPQRPVVSVASVALDGVAVAGYTVDGRGLIRNPYDGVVVINGAEFCLWGGPDRTLTVTYTHGYATVPDDVRARCLLLATRSLDSGLGNGGITQESIGDYSVAYDRTRRGGTLDDDDRQALRRYRRTWA